MYKFIKSQRTARSEFGIAYWLQNDDHRDPMVQNLTSLVLASDPEFATEAEAVYLERGIVQHYVPEQGKEVFERIFGDNEIVQTLREARRRVIRTATRSGQLAIDAYLEELERLGEYPDEPNHTWVSSRGWELVMTDAGLRAKTVAPEEVVDTSDLQTLLDRGVTTAIGRHDITWPEDLRLPPEVSKDIEFYDFYRTGTESSEPIFVTSWPMQEPPVAAPQAVL